MIDMYGAFTKCFELDNSHSKLLPAMVANYTAIGMQTWIFCHGDSTKPAGVAMQPVLLN